MPGRHRTSTKEESTGVLTFEQKAWDGGQNSDQPASAVAANEVPLLQDLVAFKGYLESHSGSQVFSNTAAPGSGTHRSLRFHATAKKWVLHRGTAVWIADATMTSWAEVKLCGTELQQMTKANDGGNQIAELWIHGLNDTNSNNGVLYGALSDAAGTRTLNLYKDLARTQLVARAQRAGDGFCIVLPQNNSGLAGELVGLAFTTADSDLTFTGSLTYGLSIDYASTLKDMGNDMVLSVRGQTFGFLAGIGTVFYIDLANGRMFRMNFSTPSKLMPDSGSESGGTPYGTRVLYTYCRIVNTSGAPDYTANRYTGTLVHESGSVRPFTAPGEPQKDYAEFWTANPINGSNPLTFYLTEDAPSPGHRLVQLPAAGTAAGHWTHLGIYRVLDIGVNGTDPVTGQANNREIYIWDQDIPFGSETCTLDTADDVLRVNFAYGKVLKTRFFQPMYNGECLGVSPNFLYVGCRGFPQVAYCQLFDKYTMGYHRPDKQTIKLDDGLQVIAVAPDVVSFICAGKSWVSSPKIYKNVGTVESIYQLRHLDPMSTTIGVTDWSSFTEIRDGLFIAHCSDHTIRQWTGLSWGPDLSDLKVRKLVRKMPIGSTMGFLSDALLLWHRIDSSAAYNNKSLRYGFGGDAGIGWSTLARSSWIFPPLYVGATRYQDSSGVDRLIALNNADGLFYWVETFDGPDSSGFSKLWLDKVTTVGTGGTEIASALVLRERTGSQEHHTIRHQESHLSLRPAVKSLGYRGAFRVDVTGYVDDTVAAHESIVNVPRAGDITFAKEHKGLRLQTRYDFAAAGFQVVRAYSRDLEDDRRALGAGYAETNEGGYQRELLGSMKHWAGRYKARLNRATGSLYTLTGDAPSQVTGPDGKSFALSFGAGSYSQASTQAYTSFSFSFWVKGMTVANRVFELAGTAFYVRFDSNTQINISGQTLAVSTIATGWHHFALVRSGSTVTVYQNGASVGTVTLAGTIGGGAITWNPGLVAMQLDDWRLQTSGVSAGAWAFYYDNVVNHAGCKVLP